MTAQVLSASDFAQPDPRWGSEEEKERRRRISLAVCCYAYEIADTPLCSDHEFDLAAQRIRPKMGTGHLLVDEFFASEFSPMTGMWIHRHPELDGIRKVYERYKKIVNPPVWRQRFVRI